MNSLTLLSNLILTFVLMISGIILLFIKTMPHSCDKPYRIAKRYIAYMWLLSSVSIIITLTIGKFSGEKYANTVTDSPALIIRTAILGTTIGILIFVIQYFKTSKEYEKVLENLFRNNEVNYSRWRSKMFYSILPILLFVTLSHIINSIYYHLAYDVMLIFVVVFITIKIINYQYLSHTILSATKSRENKQKELIENELEVIEKNKQEEPSNLSAEEAIKEQCDQKLLRTENKRRMIYESIEKWVNDEEKAYLKNGLSIQDVSLMTGIPKRRLADFIHLHYNLSFNSWVNTLRVQEVERILSNKESSTMTLSEIAYKTGFSDLSNMSSTFKKIKGMNPSEYRILVGQ